MYNSLFLPVLVLLPSIIIENCVLGPFFFHFIFFLSPFHLFSSWFSFFDSCLKRRIFFSRGRFAHLKRVVTTFCSLLYSLIASALIPRIESSTSFSIDSIERYSLDSFLLFIICRAIPAPKQHSLTHSILSTILYLIKCLSSLVEDEMF